MLLPRQALRRHRPDYGAADLWAVTERDREDLRRDGVLVLVAVGIGFVVAMFVLGLLTVVGR